MAIKPMSATEVCAFRQRCGATPMPELNAIDFSRPFVPEDLTQLYHTPHYLQLTEPQRLRYNQLFGIRTNEQFMMFEEDLANPLAAKLIDDPDVRNVPDLRRCLIEMIQEEEQHQRMFMELNRRCMPEIYRMQTRHFTRLGKLEAWVFRMLLQHAGATLFWLMVIMVLEEATTVLSRRMLRDSNTSLGPLESNFVAVHRAHLQDEARHVHVDINLIDTLMARASRAVRRRHGILFRRLIKEILTPKRSGPRVLGQLVVEYPELAPRATAMVQAVRDLGPAGGFFGGSLDATHLPHTFTLFQRYPEFALGS